MVNGKWRAMFKYKKINSGKGFIEAFSINLQNKNFVLLKGKIGYIMCGYLNMRVAEKFKDIAVKIVGVSTIEDAFKAKVAGCTSAAKRLGIKNGQAIKDVLKIIA